MASLARVLAAISAVTAVAQGASLLRRDANLQQTPNYNQSSVLECFQVSSPVLDAEGLVSGTSIVGPVRGSGQPIESCQRTLVDYSFQNSYNHPFVADYTPPPCDFNRVAMNLTVVSEGVQFDRLAVMYLGDIEVWRTSTAEPTKPPGIHWTYWKDMSNYLSLWKNDQKLIFDLGNIVNNQYTGAFNVTVTATFFTANASAKGNELEPPQVIMAISAKKGGIGQSSAFHYPGDDTSVDITVPQNAIRAIASISATGQSDEEFWQTNVQDSLKQIATGYFAGSAFREARLLIDGNVAGLAWPYPVVFTGGISPPLHRPMVGIQAFDLLEHEIDITPWLGILCDGKPHKLSLQIVAEKGETPGSYWLISGKVFAWTREKNTKQTRGAAPTVIHGPTDLDATGGGNIGSSITYSQSMARTLQVSADLEIGGCMRKYTWNQRYSMRNDGNITNAGNDQFVDALYEGESTATKNGRPYFYVGFKYPFQMDLKSTTEQGSVNITADLKQGMDLFVTGKSAFNYGLEAFVDRLDTKVAGSSVQSHRHSTASFVQNSSGSRTSGEPESHHMYKLGARGLLDRTGEDFNPAPLLYSRDVQVKSNQRVKDDVFVYDSDYDAHPENLVLGKFVGNFAPIPRPQEPGIAKFVGKDAGFGASTSDMSDTVQWDA